MGYFLSGSHDNNANVNLFGDGYENARYVGIALECLLLVLLLLVLDRASRGLRARLVLPIVLGPAFELTNSNVFTAMLTQGFILTIVVLAFAPRDHPAPQHRTVEEAAVPGGSVITDPGTPDERNTA